MKMTWTRRLAIVVGTLLALFLGVGFIFPHRWDVSVRLEINAPPETIYAHIADLRQWNEWSVWNNRVDPTVKTTYTGAALGKTAQMSWKGDGLGTGSLVITRANPENGIEYDLALPDMGFTGKGQMSFTAQGPSKTTVVWSDQGDIGATNIIGRYMVPLIESFVRSDLDKGLAGLKAAAEKGLPKSDPPQAIKVAETP